MKVRGEYAMILFVDETECEDYFIVAGLLTDSKAKTDIDSLNYSIIYSIYKKDDNKFNQVKKEKIYMQLLNNIVSNIDERINVIFDTFNKRDFEEKIINNLLQLPHIDSVKSQDSETEFGLQFIDNICSIIRLHIDRKGSTFYYLLSNYYEIKE